MIKNAKKKSQKAHVNISIQRNFNQKLKRFDEKTPDYKTIPTPKGIRTLN